MSSDPLTWLFGLEQFGIKFGLDNIAAIVAALGHPERSFASVHVAGTNGKGSVTAIVDTALRAAGHRSARYTSPHLIDLTERFVIDGQPVQREALAAVVADVRTVIDRLRDGGRLDVHPTFFEVTTAVAFELFRRAAVEIAVCEVGLGGRLDATNVVQPLVTAITSIGLDHQQYLGQTLREIAVEKAGILKPGVPVIVGKMPAEAFAAIAGIARDRGCTVVRAWDGVTVDDLRPAPDPGDGCAFGRRRMTMASWNSACEARIRSTTPSWPSGSSTRSTHEALRCRRPRSPKASRTSSGRGGSTCGACRTAARSCSTRRTTRMARPRSRHSSGRWLPSNHPSSSRRCATRPIDRMLSELATTVSAFVFTRASNPRSADPTHLADRARAIAPGLPVEVEPSPARALTAAWRIAPRIVVAGSIFLIGDVLKEIGGS